MQSAVSRATHDRAAACSSTEAAGISSDHQVRHFMDCLAWVTINAVRPFLHERAYLCFFFASLPLGNVNQVRPPRPNNPGPQGKQEMR